MEKKYQYKNIKTNEIVEDFMSEDYVIDKLGLVIMPKRKEWYFYTRTTRIYR